MNVTRNSSTTRDSDNEAFSTELHGIDYIPETSRNATLREVMFGWLGANVIFTYLVLGAIVGSLGMPLGASLAAVAVGNGFYLLLGLASVPGPRAGTGSLTISRAAFGRRANLLPASLSWLTTMGWTAVNLVIGTLSLTAMSDELGLGAGDVVAVVALLIVTMSTVSISLLGHATILAVNKAFAYLLGIGTIVLAAFVLTHGRSSAIEVDDGWGMGRWLIAVAIIGAAPLSYVNTGADYSRYLPTGVSAKRVTAYTSLGACVPALAIAVVGVIAAQATDMGDPLSGLGSIVPGYFFIVYLVIVVGGTITNNFLNTYSSGMSLLAMGVRWSRTSATVLGIAIAVILASYVIFFQDFSESLIAFLSLMVIWSSPWCGVFLADMYLRGARYDVGALHDISGGPYRYRRGWNPVAIGWFLLGVAFSAAFATSSIFTGSATHLVDGGDLSIPVGVLVAGLGYYIHTRISTPKAGRA